MPAIPDMSRARVGANRRICFSNLTSTVSAHPCFGPQLLLYSLRYFPSDRKLPIATAQYSFLSQERLEFTVTTNDRS